MQLVCLWGEIPRSNTKGPLLIWPSDFLEFPLFLHNLLAKKIKSNHASPGVLLQLLTMTQAPGGPPRAVIIYSHLLLYHGWSFIFTFLEGFPPSDSQSSLHFTIPMGSSYFKDLEIFFADSQYWKPQHCFFSPFSLSIILLLLDNRSLQRKSNLCLLCFDHNFSYNISKSLGPTCSGTGVGSARPSSLPPFSLLPLMLNFPARAVYILCLHGTPATPSFLTTSLPCQCLAAPQPLALHH